MELLDVLKENWAVIATAVLMATAGSRWAKGRYNEATFFVIWTLVVLVARINFNLAELITLLDKVN